MGETQQLISLNQLRNKQRVADRVQEQIDKKSEMYVGDFKRFKVYCEDNQMALTFESLKAYLLHTVESGLKITTFNRRAAGVKHYLVNEFGIEETAADAKAIALLRQMYNDEQFAEQKRVKGQPAQPKNEVLQQIEQLDVRAKAITLFNLVTACRPSEMIRIQFKHIDLANRSVDVYMKKQKGWHTKRLTVEVVQALKDYIKAYKLKDENYLVGQVNKSGIYTSKQISDIAYRKSMHKWLHFAPYVLRKTQVSAMHEKAADLATIAKQTGHKNLETINKHYLAVHDKTIDKYL